MTTVTVRHESGAVACDSNHTSRTPVLDVEVSGTVVRTARLKNEWFVDLIDPDAVVRDLRNGYGGRLDLFTFWQRLPDCAPRFNYYWEPEIVAALQLVSYDRWWTHQIDGKTRNLIRKSRKKGVETRAAIFDDALVDAITKVFNETPVRQSRPFLHYGKNVTQVRADMSDRLDSSVFIGAYAGDELIGFVKLLLLREYAMMVEIVSEIRHRDKAPNNALVAAAVRECVERGIRYLTYSTWGTATLADFKRKNGFEKVALPRYYVPLSPKGRLVLGLKLQRGIWPRLPKDLKEGLRRVRGLWYRLAGQQFR